MHFLLILRLFLFILKVVSTPPPCCMVQVPRGVYHTCRCLEPGSVIFEAKDRPYDPAGTEDFLR